MLMHEKPCVIPTLSIESSTSPPSLTLKGSPYRGIRDEILDWLVPAYFAYVLEVLFSFKLFCTGSAVTISKTVVFWFTPKRQWSMKAEKSQQMNCLPSCRFEQARVFVELAKNLKDITLPQGKQPC